MVVTLEQVERLREKADVSYEEAKALLERHQGDLLEALIELERRGKADTAATGGFYTTRPDTPQPDDLAVQPGPAAGGARTGWEYRRDPEEPRSGRGFLRDLCRASVVNYLEIWREGQRRTTIPILVLILLIVGAFYVTLPLLVAGLFLGFRYRFGGPDLDREGLNQVMDQVSKTAEQVRQSVQETIQKQK